MVANFQMIGDARVGVDGRKIHAGDVDLHVSVDWRVNRPATSKNAPRHVRRRVPEGHNGERRRTVQRSSAYA